MGNSLVQGSCQQNRQKVMDSKEMWSHNLLGLVAHSSSQNSWKCAEVMGRDGSRKRRSDLEEDNESDLEHVDLGRKIRKPRSIIKVQHNSGYGRWALSQTAPVKVGFLLSGVSCFRDSSILFPEQPCGLFVSHAKKAL